MLIYLLRRLALAASVVFATIVVTFALFYIAPNDPAGAICGNKCTPQTIKNIEHTLGLDQPKTVQFERYVKGLAVGTKSSDYEGAHDCSAPCLGWSFQQNRSVTDIVKQAFPITLSIVLGGLVVYSLAGIVLGVIAARFRGRALDRIVVGLSQLITAIPYYVLALVFYLYFMKKWAVIPESSYTSPLQSPVKWALGLLGVWLFFGLYASCNYIRYVRASMIDSQGQDYVRTARSKGLSERKVVFGHALRAAIAPFLTLVGMSIALELTGAIFTETIFTLPGMGLTAYRAQQVNDLPVISGTVIVGAILIVLANILVDILYGVVDPRVKLK